SGKVRGGATAFPLPDSRLPSTDYRLEQRDMKSKPTGQILLDWGLVTSAQLEAAVEAQKGLPSQEALGDTLVNMGIITERDKLRCMAEQWGCRFVDVEGYELNPDVVKLLSQEIAR